MRADRRQLRFAPLLAAAIVFVAAHAAAQPTLPTGFTDAQLASLNSPTDLNFLPDGRVLITTQGGALRVYCPNNSLPGCGTVAPTGGLLNTAALNVPGTCTGSERGLLGVAVDPAFGSGNTHIYLFYTATSAGAPGGCVNRVSRFTYNTNTNTVSTAPAETLLLVDNMTATNGNHNAGDVDFGKDGYLYITIGDGGCDYNSPTNCQDGNDAARDEHRLTGKVLRIEKNGDIPPSNPWASTGDRCNVTGGTTEGRRCQETYSWGHRNPFRMALDPNATGTRFFVNDVGGGAFEEVDELISGGDFGWNCREGRQPRSQTGLCSPAPPNMIDPVLAYGRSAVGASSEGLDTGSCASITGGAFVPNGAWSSAHDNMYLFADYVCGRMFMMPAVGYNQTRVPTFGSNFGGSSITSMRFGPGPGGQALYYTSYEAGTAGGLHRIVYSYVKAVVTANPPGGPVGTTVTFDGSGSTDPNGLVLTYLWDFNGDGTDDLTNATPTATFTYNTCGAYNARLLVRNSSGELSDPATVVISICAPPKPVIVDPTTESRFSVGQSVTLRGYARNSSEQLLPSSSIRWTVLLHHDTHTHPLVPEQTGSACTVTLPPGSNPPTVAGSCRTFTTPAPEDFAAANNSYLDVLLEATDGQGLVGNAPTFAFQPLKVTLNFATDPPGQPLRLNGVDSPTPLAAVSWANYVVTAQALSPQNQPNGQTYVFSGWTDGNGTNPRSITTPTASASYTARYVDDGTHRRRFQPMTPCRLIDTRGAAGVPIGGPALASGSTRTFTLTGQCGIPAGVRALAANVTVVSPTQQGDLRLFPTGGSATSSNINFRANQTRANNASLSLSASGQVSVTCAMAAAGNAHFLLDVVGYYQ